MKKKYLDSQEPQNTSRSAAACRRSKVCLRQSVENRLLASRSTFTNVPPKNETFLRVVSQIEQKSIRYYRNSIFSTKKSLFFLEAFFPCILAHHEIFTIGNVHLKVFILAGRKKPCSLEDLVKMGCIDALKSCFYNNKMLKITPKVFGRENCYLLTF